MSFGVGRKFRERVGRHAAVHNKKERHHADGSDRLEIREGIERQVRKQEGIDGDVAGAGEAERVAVGRRARDGFHGDVAARPGAVVDHHRLAASVRDMGAEDPGCDVGDAARRGRDDDLDRLGRIGFRKNRSGARNQPGGKRNQAQQLGESFAGWHRV